MVKERIKSAVKKTANALGFDIQYLSKVPRHNALGLRSMGIRTVLDVGANSGQFAKFIHSVLPTAKVICFEPLPGPFLELNTWANSQNGWVTAYNLALGEKRGSVEMFQHTEFTASSSLLHSTAISHSYYPFTKRETPLTVRMMPLDEFLDQSEIALEHEILIKLDVQGYEDRVIRGGRRVFSVAKGCISEINFDVLYEGQSSFKEVWTLLDELHYRYAGTLDQTYASDGHAIFADALFIR